MLRNKLLYFSQGLSCAIMFPERCPTPSSTLAIMLVTCHAWQPLDNFYTFSYLYIREKHCLKEEKSIHIKLLFIVQQMNSCLKATYNNGYSVINSFFNLFIIIQGSLALRLVMSPLHTMVCPSQPLAIIDSSIPNKCSLCLVDFTLDDNQFGT